MKALVTALVGLVVVGACSPSARDHRSSGKDSKDGSGQPETDSRKASVLRPVRALDVNLAQLAGGTFTPGARVIGLDGTASFEVPGPAPGKIAHLAADGAVTVAEGRLVADAPLRFVREADHVQAVSFDGRVVYAAVERVTSAAAWSATTTSTDCCGWWEHTLWRASPRALDAGLLRVVTPPAQTWSVIDFHQPKTIEPRWRVLLTQGKGAAVAAAVSPRADQVVVVVAAAGTASLQARGTQDGAITWEVALGGPSTDWRRGDSRVVYSHDGARVAVLVEDAKRCEACTAIEVFDTARGERLGRVAIESIITPRFTSIGLSGDTVWLFERILRSRSELADRPERCQYEAYDLSGKRRAAPAADWGLGDCAVWALAPRFDGPGVVALAQRDQKLLWLAADAAP
jgi:hypothetical protein